MKLTRTQLQEIIKEELEKALNETDDTPPEPTIEKQIEDADADAAKKCAGVGAKTSACRAAAKKVKDLRKQQRTGASAVRRSDKTAP